MKKLFTFILTFCLHLHLNAYAAPQVDTYNDDDFNDQASYETKDPWEKINRKTFALNKGLDKVIFLPINKIYTTLTPSPLRTMVHSFLNNLREPLNIIHAIIQLNPSKAGNAMGRFLVNTTWGVAGFYDVAQYAGLEYKEESLGKTTMSRYGMKPGPYLILPILGPSNVRDALGIGGDIFIDPVNYMFKKDSKVFRDSGKFLKENNRLISIGSRAIDAKYQSIDTINQIEQMSLDEYATIRNLYSQKYR